MTKKTFTLDGIQDLRKAGLYFLYKNDVLVYIGVSKNIYVRVLEHCFDNTKDFDSIKAISTKDNANRTVTEIMEVFLISNYKPKYNKLIASDIFTYFNTLPSSIKSIIGKDNFNEAIELSKVLQYDFNKRGYKK